MSKTPFLTIVAGALLALHHHGARHVELSTDSRLVWTTRQGGGLQASLSIRSQNQVRIIIWRCANRDDGSPEAESKILDRQFADVASRSKAEPVIILEHAPDTSSTRYRFEVLTCSAEDTGWRSLSSQALRVYPAENNQGASLNFEDSPNPSEPGSDFQDIIISLRES